MSKDKYKNVFSEDMSSSKARLKLFEMSEGKSKLEVKELQEAYNKVIDKIIDRELDLAQQGILT